MLSLLGIGFCLGVLVSWMTLRVMRSIGVLAEPNSRSSHDVPTPTSGGVGFVLVILGFVLLQGEGSLALAVLLGGGVLGALGLADDLLQVPAGIRLMGHCVMAAAALWLLSGTDLTIDMTIGQRPLGGAWFAIVLWLIGVWFINLYNFMDGIDGIAATQLLIYSGGVGLLGATDGFAAELVWFAGAVVGGFLIFNWAPARIFMGDVGSGFLGFLVWMVALGLALTEMVPFVASIVLLTVFWFDATYTLGVRIVTGQAFASAHRSHLYQRLAQRLGHGTTVVIFVGYAVGWLYPLSAAVLKAPEWWLCWVALGCAPMAVACWRAEAGRLDSNPAGY